MTLDMKSYIKIAWLTLCLLVLITTLLNYDGKPNSDVDIFMIWGMLLLSFPFGFLAALALSLFSYIVFEFFEVVIATSIVSIIMIWSVYLMFGYVQWFIILPVLRKKFLIKGS